MKKSIKRILFYFIFLLSMHLVAQDIHFSQFYANPIYLNPAYTGATFEHRFIGNYRNQWPGISKTYSSYAASYDYNMTDINSGVGIQVMQDRSGTSRLTTTAFMASYAYYYSISKFKDIRMGLQLGYISKYFDLSDVVFNDQLYTGSSVSTDFQNIAKVNFVNINAGALYTTPYSWVGVSFHNLNKPNASMVDGSSPLPVKFSIHGGHKFVISKKGNFLEKYFAPALNYRHQNKFDQLDIGAYYFFTPLSVGLWYRGIPFKRYKPTYQNIDALCVLLGVDIKDYDMRIGFSYDVNLSRLASKSFGAAELSIIYEVAKKSRRKKMFVSCPKF